MARCTVIDTHPRLLPVNLAAQLRPGTCEHAVDHLLDHAIDRSRFDARFRNDTTGAPAYPPAVLPKVVLCAYARGIGSSRDPDIAHVFAAVLAVCDQQGLIGREMFAIDGVKLPSNASRRRSRTRADFERQAEKLEAAAARMLTRHQATDATEDGPPAPPNGPPTSRRAREAEGLVRLERDAAQLRAWLAAPPDERRRANGAVRQRHRTDPDSAKLATGKGVIQGDTAVAAVDAQAQIIVEAKAHGTGTEQERLLPVVTALAPHAPATTLLTADAGDHREANLRTLAAQGRPALRADNGMRRRDERFATQARHQQGPDPLHDTSRPPTRLPLYQPHDFTYDPVARTCVKDHPILRSWRSPSLTHPVWPTSGGHHLLTGWGVGMRRAVG